MVAAVASSGKCLSGDLTSTAVFSLNPAAIGLGGVAHNRKWVDARVAFRVEHAYRDVFNACEQERCLPIS
jgi:hypothetical protein